MNTADLPALDVAGRIDRLRALFPEAGIDALFVTRLVNIRYLTGFTGSAGLLLVGPDEVLFVSDGRYKDQSADQLAAAGVPARIEISGTEQKKPDPKALAAFCFKLVDAFELASNETPRRLAEIEARNKASVKLDEIDMSSMFKPAAKS